MTERCPSLNAHAGGLCDLIEDHRGHHTRRTLAGPADWVNLRPGHMPRISHATLTEGRTTMPQRYRTKPVEVEAMLFDGAAKELMHVYHWVEANTEGSFEPLSGKNRDGKVVAHGVSIDPANGQMFIRQNGYDIYLTVGQYVVREVATNRFRTVFPDIFEDVYEAVEEMASEVQSAPRWADRLRGYFTSRGY